MPAAGKTKTPNAVKARIIAEKRVGMGTAAAIAERHGVAEQTVRNLASSPPPAVLPMVEKLTTKFNEEAVEIAGLVFKEIKRRVKEEPKKEATKNLVAVGKMVYDVHRLETNQPTSINQNQRSPLELAIEFANNLLMRHPDPSEAKMIFGYANTARVGIGASEEEWKEAAITMFGDPDHG